MYTDDVRRYDTVGNAEARLRCSCAGDSFAPSTNRRPGLRAYNLAKDVFSSRSSLLPCFQESLCSLILVAAVKKPLTTANDLRQSGGHHKSAVAITNVSILFAITVRHYGGACSRDLSFSVFERQSVARWRSFSPGAQNSSVAPLENN